MHKPSAVLLGALALPLLLLSPQAGATSHHTQVTVTPIKNEAGKTTGAEIYAVLQSSGHKFVRFGLLPSQKDMPASGYALKQDIMKAKSARWLHVSPDQDVSGGAADVTLRIDYAKSKVVPGGSYQLGSVWSAKARDTDGEHLWGPHWQGTWGDPEIVLPK